VWPHGAIAAGLEVGAVASPPGPKSFAPLDAIASSHSGPCGQARWSQGWKGAVSIGPGCGTWTKVRAAGAQPPPLTATRGHWPAGRGARCSSVRFCHGYLPAWGSRASQVDRICGTDLSGMRAAVRPGSQTGRFRSRWHDEVATTGLLGDDRAQAQSRIEDQYCR
jgi:hypothetical protein